jgi:uncharacterized protein YdhG (YjbR/CyaY superfamily)
MKSKKPTTVDEYIAGQPEVAAKQLIKIRQIVLKNVPEAEEVLSYSMPAFRYHGMLIWYAAFTGHYSIFPTAETIKTFEDRLTKYETSKGTIRFPINKPLPVKLITDIVKYRAKQSLNKFESRKARK